MRRKIQQEEERMRGVETRIQEIRHAIFTEVAKMAYDVDSPVEKTIEEIPYRVIPGEVGNFRNDVFLERAIVGERLRLAMGLPCRSAAEHARSRTISNWRTRRRRIIHRRSLMSSNLHATPVMKTGSDHGGMSGVSCTSVRGSLSEKGHYAGPHQWTILY